MQDEYTTVFTTYCLIWTKLWFETTSIDAVGVIVVVVHAVVVHAVVVHAVVVDAVVVAQQKCIASIFFKSNLHYRSLKVTIWMYLWRGFVCGC